MGQFGDMVRSLRRGKHLYLKDLADEMGWSIAYLSQIETGNRKPPAKKHILKLADVLGIHPTVLLDTSDRERRFVRVELSGCPMKDTIALRLSRCWDTISDEQLDAIHIAITGESDNEQRQS